MSFAYPQGVQLVSLHFTEDFCCLGDLVHGSDIPCPKGDLELWPKQSLLHTPDMLPAFIGGVHTAAQKG